jgi:hypothetical protein
MFNEKLKNNEHLEMKLHCFYYYNQSFEALSNYTLQIRIFDNNSLYYINEYTTDKFGFLSFLITQEDFNYNYTNHDFKISIFFHGTFILRNKTITKSFKIEKEIYSEITSSSQVKFLSFISILVIVLVVFSYIITNKRSKSGKILTELIVKY